MRFILKRIIVKSFYVYGHIIYALKQGVTQHPNCDEKQRQYIIYINIYYTCTKKPVACRLSPLFDLNSALVCHLLYIYTKQQKKSNL